MEYENYDGYWDGEKFVEQVQICTFLRSSESWLIRCRSRIKSYQCLRGCMAQVIKLWSWLITYRVIQHGQRMHYVSKTWIWIQVARCPASETGGLLAIVCEFHSQLSFHPIIQPFLTNQKGWKLFSRNTAFGVMECFSSAEIQNEIQLQCHDVLPKLLNINLTFLLKGLLSKKLLKQLGTFAFSSQNSTVSSIFLGCCETLSSWALQLYFAGLQEDFPKALESVDISTIWKWEHRMIRCIRKIKKILK